MNSETISRLSSLILCTFRCECEFVDSELVSETYKGRPLWTGEVARFRLLGNEEMGECFGWVADSLSGSLEPVIVPQTSEIDSASEAVRAYLLGLCDHSD